MVRVGFPFIMYSVDAPIRASGPPSNDVDACAMIVVIADLQLCVFDCFSVIL